jgi:PKD repeat protein
MNKVPAVLIIVVLSIGLFFSVLPLKATGADTSATLYVTVLDGANYYPIAGANVSISGPLDLMEVTSAEGKVVFSNIASGTYMITSTAPRYPMSNPQTVQVTGNTTVTLLYGHTNAFFTFNPQLPLLNQTITFDASQSTSTGTITGYTWDFGDGATSNNASATHTYTNPGEYRVALTVTSTIGAATYTQAIRVSAGPYDNVIYLLLIPIILPLIIAFLWLRRRRYYVVIQARIPPNRLHPHCPGNGDCDNCNLTPC